jgi:hypothetical protein
VSRRKTAIALLFLFLAASAIGFLVVRSTKTQAQGFLAAYRTLAVGTTSYDNAKQQLADYRAILKPPSSCTQQECDVVFNIENSLLHRLHLAPPTGLSGTLYFRNDILVAKYVYFGQGMCCVVRVAELLPQAMKSSKGLDVRVQADDHGSPMRAFFTLAADATSEQASYAYDFNLSCISKLRGCNSANELHTLRWYRVAGMAQAHPDVAWDQQEFAENDMTVTVILGTLFALALAVLIPVVNRVKKNRSQTDSHFLH